MTTPARIFWTLAAGLWLSAACGLTTDPEPERPQCTDPTWGDDLMISSVTEKHAQGGSVRIGRVWGTDMDDLFFTWDNGAAGPRLEDAPPGVYTVTITNADGCTASETYDLRVDEPTGFRVGDTGPGGGVVFEVDSAGTSGLETAPLSTIWSGKTWGCSGTSFETSQDEGSGPENTATILAGCTESDVAARLADDLTAGGFDDWHLPSSGELEALAYTIYSAELQEMGWPSGYYWSSSEAFDTMAYAVRLPAGGSMRVRKDQRGYVIAVRSFSPGDGPSEPGRPKPDPSPDPDDRKPFSNPAINGNWRPTHAGNVSYLTIDGSTVSWCLASESTDADTHFRAPRLVAGGHIRGALTREHDGETVTVPYTLRGDRLVLDPANDYPWELIRDSDFNPCLGTGLDREYRFAFQYLGHEPADFSLHVDGELVGDGSTMKWEECAYSFRPSPDATLHVRARYRKCGLECTSVTWPSFSGDVKLHHLTDFRCNIIKIRESDMYIYQSFQ